MMTPLRKNVTVVVTTFNHSAYIRQALDSIVSQHVDGLEIIVVDDGSTDNTYSIAQEFAGRRTQVIRKENGGPSSAVNFGVAHASGDTIVLFSADDVMKADSIERRLYLLRNGVADFVCSLPEWIGGDGYILPNEACPIQFLDFGGMKPFDLFKRLYYNGNFICAPSMALTRSAWDDVGLFDESLWQLQDYDYWLRATALGKRFYCLTEPCVSYRWHGRNLSSDGGSLTAWESDIIQTRTPELLSREDMLEMLFGSSFRTFETALLTEDCRVLIRMRHVRSSIALGAKFRFQEIISEAKGSDRLYKSLT